MSFEVFEQAIVILINIIGVWLGFLVWNNDRKGKLNQWFGLMAASILLWVDFAYLANGAKEIAWAVLWYKLNMAAVSLFLASFYYFYILHFLREKGKSKIFGKIILFCALAFAVISIFTDLVIKNVVMLEWGANAISGQLDVFFSGFALFVALLVLYYSFKRYFSFPRQEKLKLQYFLIGLLFFIALNIIFNVVSPILLRTTEYQHFGDYSAILLLGFTAYAIVKRELFGMRVVLTTLVVGAIAVLLALDTFLFTSQPILQVLKAIILAVFIYFGYLLIKSVLEERKRREQLERLTSQLQIAHVKLSAAYEKLQRLDKAKSEFVSIASHQLRTPLTAIKGYISMLLEGTYGNLGVKLKKPIENVYKSNERLIKLVNDLLSVSRIEAGRLAPKFGSVKLEELVESVVNELKIQAESKELKLKWEKPAAALPEVNIDSTQIRQVILNIVDNAIRYTDEGSVAVRIKKQARGLVVEVADTGEGMNKEEISTLFESFSRGTAGTRFWTEGTGLGLYVAKKFVEMNHGKVWAESQGKGKGSAFYIELPIA